MRTVLNRNNKGFTLVELVVIIIIIGITSAVATVSFSSILNKQRLDTDYAVAESLSNEIEGIVLDEKVMNAYINKRNSIITLFWTEEQMYDGNIYVSAQEGGTALVPTDVFEFVDTSIYSAMNRLFNNENLPKSQSGKGFTLVLNLSSKDPKGYVVVGDSMSLARNSDSNNEEEDDGDYNTPSIIDPGDIPSDDDTEVTGCLPSNYNSRGATWEFTNKFKNATKIVFTDAQPRRGVNFADCSAQHNMSIVYWNEGTVYYISTRRTGVKVKANENSRGMFFELDKLEELDLRMLDTSETTNMCDMFKRTYNLKVANVGVLDVSSVTTLNSVFCQSGYPGVLDLTSWSTSSSLTDLSWAFYGMPNVTEIKFSPNFNTSNVTNMSYVFSTAKSGNCNVTSKLKKLDLSMFDTGNVTNMQHIFSELDSIEDLNVANWDVRKVSNFKLSFYKCNAKVLDLSGWETASATNMNSMFKDCSSLISLYIPKFTITNVIGNGFADVFNNCVSLESLDLSNLGIPYGETEPVELQITSLAYSFRNTKKLVSINFKNFKPVNVESLSNTFNTAYSLDEKTYRYIENWELRNIKDLSYTFCAGILQGQCRENLHSLDLSKWSGNITSMEYFLTVHSNSPSYLTEINFGKNLKFDNCTNFKFAFSGCKNIVEFDFSKNGTTKFCTHFNSMFKGDKNLTQIIGYKQFFDFSSVTSINSMFNGCNSLKELLLGDCPVNSNSLNADGIVWAFNGCCSLTSDKFSLPDFNTRAVTNFNNLFSDCDKLTYLDISWIEWDSAISVSNLFKNCVSLDNLDLSGLSNAHNIENMEEMFRNCRSLNSLDVSSLHTEKVKNMGYMFYLCANLEELDVSSFNTEKVTNMTHMFGSCYKIGTGIEHNVKEMKLKHIFVSDKFITRNVKDSEKMFADCKNLPNYDSAVTDLTKAIDESLGGYLTLKN